MSASQELVADAAGNSTAGPPTGYRGADMLAEGMVAQGIEVVFGVPGLQLDPVFDAFHAVQDRLRIIHTRHEQAASYMADGYARATGKTGCCIVVPGPGLLNAGAGLATAAATSSPVVAIVADIAAADRGRDRGVLHEIPGQFPVLRAVTKQAIDVSSPQSIGVSFTSAVRATRELNTGPVGLQIPADYLEASVRRTPVGFGCLQGASTRFDSELDRAIEMVRGAERPLILVGGGAIADDAGPAVTELAHLLDAPVIMSRMGRGAVDDRDPLAFTSVMLSRLLPDSDVVIAVGSKLLHAASLLAGMDPARRPRLIQIDANPLAIGRGFPVDLGIVGGASAVLSAIIAELSESRAPSEWAHSAFRLGQAVGQQLASFSPQAELAAAVRDVLPEDGIVVSGMTQLGYWANVGFPVWKPRTFLSSGYQGTLGFEYATALGAKVGMPSTPVACLVGDGGFMFNVAELATAAQHGIAAAAIVFNDGAFGNVRRIQQERFEGRVIASDLKNPDFLSLASAFDIAGFRANGPDELRKALHSALESNRPALIEVPVGAMRDVRILG